MPCPVCNYVHIIVLQFYVYFLHVCPSCGQLLFPCLASSLSCAILSYAGLLEVPATYLGSLSYFLARGLVLPNGCSIKKLMINGGSIVYNQLSLVMYPKRVYFASLMLTIEYWGSGCRIPLNKDITIT
jgi:hypothetical protein